MSDTQDFDDEVSAFRSRVADLELSLTLQPPGDPVVEAVLLELQAASEELRVATEELTVRGHESGLRQATSDRDRQVMRAVFRDLPLATILLDRDARIRRLNKRASETLGVSLDYASGQPFANFVELGSRATFRSVLAGVLRGSGDRIVRTTVLRGGSPLAVELLLSLLPVPSDPQPLVSVVALPPRGAQAEARPNGTQGLDRGHDDDLVVRSMARRLDLLTGLSRLLLIEHGRSEASTLQSAARLLCAELADWVVVDLTRRGELVRAVVCGPTDRGDLTTELEQADVAAATYPGLVIHSPGAVLHTSIEDPHLLGKDRRGVPFLFCMGAQSLLGIPLLVDGYPIGAITAVRSTGRAPFTLVDQSLLQEMTDQLGLALKSERRFQRRSDIARAVRATLLPDPIRIPPGIELAIVVRAPEDAQVGGDFLDTIQGPRWAVVLGDAAGSGEPALAQAALARHAVALFSLEGDDPPAVLRRVDHAIRALPDSERPIRIVMAGLEITATGVTAHLHSAGHLSSMVLRSDGRVHSVDGGGTPLGGPEPLLLHSQQVHLELGDCLVLCSDAVSTLVNARGEEFLASGGLARSLARATGQPAATVVTSVETEMRAFTPGGLVDDLVLIAIRPDPPPRPAP